MLHAACGIMTYKLTNNRQKVHKENNVHRLRWIWYKNTKTKKNKHDWAGPHCSCVTYDRLRDPGVSGSVMLAADLLGPVVCGVTWIEQPPHKWQPVPSDWCLGNLETKWRSRNLSRNRVLTCSGMQPVKGAKLNSYTNAKMQHLCVFSPPNLISLCGKRATWRFCKLLATVCDLQGQLIGSLSDKDPGRH